MLTAPLECHIEITQQGKKAVELLSAESGLSKQKIKQAMDSGAVWLTTGQATRRLRRSGKPVAVGNTLHLYYNAEVLKQQPSTAELIADEQCYSVWYKPTGMFSQGSKWGDHCALYRWVEKNHWPERKCYIVHRLDRAASGLILLAHDKKTAAALAGLFERRELKKSYRVAVHGELSASFSMHDSLDERTAITHASPLCYEPALDCTLLDVDIETGRKHQIRRHLAAAGYPVVGDRLYGNGDDLQDLQLTACRLQFLCPLTGVKKDYRLGQQLMPVLQYLQQRG